MAKNADKRITDTLNEIPRLIRGDGVFIKEAIHDWLAQATHAGQRAAISAELAFGWRGIGPKSAVITQDRHYRRALLLAKRTIGGVTGAQYTAFKLRVGQLTEAQCRTQLVDVYRQAAPQVLLGNGDPVFGSTFDHIEEDKQACTLAVGEAIETIERALTDGIRRVHTVAAEKTRFKKWFGKPVPARIDAVASVLERMYKDVHRKSIRLYNRGKSLNASLQTDDVAAVMRIDDYGYSVPDTRRDNQRFVHVFIGSKWFTRGVDRSVFDGTKLNNRVSRAGTIIHELSHAICNTVDAEWNGGPMYFPTNCQAAARANSTLVLNNADSYRLYCEEFFQV